jgi:predicted hotdog family 3-hydroxylacyl-ACP dehydratase
VNPLNDEYMAQLGSTLVSLLQRRQAAEEEGFLVEVMEIEAALSVLRAELAVVAERRRSGR